MLVGIANRGSWAAPVTAVLLTCCSGSTFTGATEEEPLTAADGEASTSLAPSPDELETTEAQPTESPAPSSGGATAAGGSSGAAAGGADGGGAAAGGADSGGAGGAETEPPEFSCPSVTDGDLKLLFFPEFRESLVNEIHPFFRIKNLGATPVEIHRLSVRYHYTPESFEPGVMGCYWTTAELCDQVNAKFVEAETPVPGATHYMELSVDAPDIVVGSDSFEMQVGFYHSRLAKLDQTNDYSFDPNAEPREGSDEIPYRLWEGVTLYVDGELAYGVEPCSQP